VGYVIYKILFPKAISTKASLTERAVTWNPDFFPINSTVTIGLNYVNNSKVSAWTSNGMPREKGFVTVTMQNDWLQGQKLTNLTFIAISYTPASDHTASPYQGPLIMLQTPSLPVPSKTKAPDARSLIIGLPVALGGCALIIAVLFFLNRSTRKIGLGSIMGRRRGYGVGKSRRQRLGLEKGAIRLQNREVMPDGPTYRDDDITPVPRMASNRPPAGQPGVPGSHAREESLGSLVSEDDPNAFRREMRAQGRQR
jgi:Ykl077w/Psg1 (Pma1 Stabilization in Golgi)